MVTTVPNTPYLYLEEGVSLTQLGNLLSTYKLEAIPKERYYYNYSDAIRIIDFVQTKGIYDGWVLLIKSGDIATANQLLRDCPEQFRSYLEVEREFLEGLSSALLQQIVGSKHATGERLQLIQLLLKERGTPMTIEEITTMKELVQVRNQAQQPNVRYAKALIWTGVILIALGYLWLVGMFG